MKDCRVIQVDLRICNGDFSVADIRFNRFGLSVDATNAKVEESSAAITIRLCRAFGKVADCITGGNVSERLLKRVIHQLFLPITKGYNLGDLGEKSPGNVNCTVLCEWNGYDFDVVGIVGMDSNASDVLMMSYLSEMCGADMVSASDKGAYDLFGYWLLSKVKYKEIVPAGEVWGDYILLRSSMGG